MTEQGRLGAKQHVTEGKVPMPTGVIYSLARGHFHALLMLSCHPAEGNDTLQAFASLGGYSEMFILKDWTEFVSPCHLKEIAILCIFLLLYRHFVIKQDETHLFEEWPHLLLRDFFLLGRRNVGTKPYCAEWKPINVYNSSDEDSCRGINEPMPLQRQQWSFWLFLNQK